VNETNLTTEDADLWERLIDKLRLASRWQKAIKVVFVIGGATIGAIGGALEGSLFSPNASGLISVKGFCVILGALMALLGGVLLLFVTEDSSDLLHKAKIYIRTAKHYFDEREVLLQLDDKRRSLLDMQAEIYEACEQYPQTEPIDELVKTILYLASVNLTASIGFDNGERWAFSIFKKVGGEDGERMERIAVHWANRGGENQAARSWKKQQGFTGWAWHDNDELIVADAREDQWNGKYFYQKGNQSVEDRDLYVSAAAIPIKIGAKDEIWGVITATSNTADRFKRNLQDVRSQNVETVRVLARLIASQVALRMTN